MALSLSLDQFALLLLSVLASSFLALFTALVFRLRIGMEPAGTDVMQSIASKIRRGAMAFLWREYVVIILFIAIASCLLYVFIDTGVQNVREGLWDMPFNTISFLCGALLSICAGFIGMRTATVANVRTTNAARTSLAMALRIAFLSGANMGLSVVGLGLGGIVAVFLIFTYYFGLPVDQILQELAGFSFGASSVALFARVGGGIYTKAADVGADLVGKVEKNIPEDDPRNPAVIADNVGDNVGDVAGMGADLYESYVGSIIAAMMLGLTFATDAGSTRYEYGAVLFPLLLSGIGIVASVLGTFFVRVRKGSTQIHRALKSGLVMSSLLVIAGSAWLCFNMFTSTEVALSVFIALTSGLIAGVVIGWLTEYYTSADYKPVKHLAKSSETGAATVVISGLALGYMSTMLPVLVICVAVGLAFYQAGLYGIAISGVGMLSTLGISLAIDAYGPVADNAGGIAEMSGLPKQVRARTDELDSAGNTTAAIGKGFAIGSAALTALALFAAYTQSAGLSAIDVANPLVLIGLLIGAMMPYLFSALTMNAVGRAAFAMIAEVRRQFKEIKGLMEGKAEGDPARCVSIATGAAIKEMIAPGILAVVVPITVGFVLGTQALGGLLAGSLATGVLLAISMANSGGAWDNAKKYIEAGHYGGKGSDSHKAAVVGDTIGDPFKDTSGPSINILIKLMTIISLLTVGLYTTGGLIG